MKKLVISLFLISFFLVGCENNETTTDSQNNTTSIDNVSADNLLEEISNEIKSLFD